MSDPAPPSNSTEESAGLPQISVPLAGVVAVPDRTIADVATSLAPGWTCDDFLAWPPDGFALAAAVLSESGAYRLIVSPPAGMRWPPRELAAEAWESAVERWAREWSAWAADSRSGSLRPRALARIAMKLRAVWELPLAALDEPHHWETLVSLLTLHAMADDACAGLGVHDSAAGSPRAWATELLLAKGTLSRVPASRARVLPKSALPRTGISIRSLSRHLALDRSETEVRWLSSDAKAPPLSHFTLLLVPYPARITRADFRAIPGPLGMDGDQYGFFEFAPRPPLDVGEFVDVVEAGWAQTGGIDAVVLPESVLRHEEADRLRSTLHALGVPNLIAGVREHATSSVGLGLNYAYVTGIRDGVSWAAVQYKHHRWLLDEGQIKQYRLEERLYPGRQWWEAIGIERRTLTFVTIDEFLTLCPLICEDLAQPDPVATIIREVGPTLVIGLLLDGPQLAARWPARYASVFADDPGCAVLTLTSLGMARRSEAPGFGPSRSVALWKDARSGILELSLDEGASAIAVTASVEQGFATTADGRSAPVAQLLLDDVRQVRVSRAATTAGRRRGDGHADVPEAGAQRPGAMPARALPDLRSAEAMYACDWDGRVVSWNQAAERLTGIAASESIGRRCWEVIRGKDQAGNDVCQDGCEVSRRVKRGRPVSCPPIVLQTKAGSRWIEISTLIVREGSQPLAIHTVREATWAAPRPALSGDDAREEG